MSRHAARLAHVEQLLAAGRGEQARAHCQRLVQAAPRDAAVNLAMARTLLHLGDTARALHFAGVAASLSGGDPEALVLQGRLLSIEGRAAAAEEVLRRALAAAPAYEGARQELAGALVTARHFSEAEALCREGLAVSPGSPGLSAVLAGCLLNLGRIEELVALMHTLVRDHPENQLLASGLSLMLNYAPGVSRQEVFAAHRRYAELLDLAQPPMPVQYQNTPDPERRLRVGIVSPDLRQHSVAFFMEPFLEGHDRSRIELYVYQTNRVSDSVTARLRPNASVWRVMDNITDLGLASVIHNDRIDVLVELSGHTHAHALPAMHLRPAPVQVTYLGYPNTTGLPQIDWRLTDSAADPPGAEAFHAEKLWRLDPCFLCFRPPVDSPAPAPPPSASGAPVTFASFNTVQKLNRELVALWARLLSAAPGSRLLLKSVNFADAPLRAEVAARFAAAGVEPARIQVLPPRDAPADHLASYAMADIALDPHPYNGTTTSCEALWMGVPVVSLAGDRHASRVGASILAAAGLPELIAASPDQYISLAAALAADPARLDSLRRTLRQRVADSPLRDEGGFCDRFGAALRGMWRTWCAGTLPA